MNIKKWLNTPPSPNDLFLVNFRLTWQRLFPCKHGDYVYESDSRRVCVWRGDLQYLGYNKFGPVRYEWTSFGAKMNMLLR